MARFSHLATSPLRGPSDLLRWRVLDTLAGRRMRDPAGYAYTTPVRPNDGAVIATAAPSLTWIGHATFVLRLGGVLVATDPIWSDRIAGVISASRRPACRSTSLPPLDVVTVTHNHYDHLDVPTLRRIGKRAALRPLPGNAPFLRAAGARQDRGARLVAVASHRRARDHAGARAALVDARAVESQRRAVGRLRLPRARGRRVPLGRHRAVRRLRRDRASAPGRSTGRCCRSAPTSRAGSWSRST